MRLGSAILLAASLAAAPLAGAQTFDFETTPDFTLVPFSVTSGGLTATFTSAGSFMVQPSPFLTLLGRVLKDDDGISNPLTITFSAPLTGISLRFGTDAPFSTTGLTLEALFGATVVGSANAPGAVPPGSPFPVPEGTITFAGPAFTSVVLSSSAPDFAVDDIVVRQVATVPEPTSVALVGTGVLLTAGAAARRRRRADAAKSR